MSDRGSGTLLRAVALLVAALTVAAVAWASRGPGGDGGRDRPEAAGPGTGGARRATPARFPGGPTGGEPNVDLRPGAGMFATECAYSHSSNDDPIVFPGEAGAAHHHDFFGNVATDADSTPASLRGGRTTCRLHSDTAAYWAPALLRDGEYVRPVSSDAYYRVAPGVDPDDVRPYPRGLMMIGGDSHATEPQPLQVVAWACDRSRRVSVRPPACPDGTHLTMRVTFPDCWDGRRTDSRDHRAHVAASGAGGCPASHPVPMPLLTLVVHYPVYEADGGLDLSPGSILTGHADFVNAWDPRKLAREIDHCLRAGLVCGPPGGTGGSPPTFSPV